MTHGEKIEQVKDLAARLNALMQEPEPGLVSWNIAVGRLLTQLSAFAPAKEEGAHA